MNIRELTEKINDRAVAGDFDIAHLHKLRQFFLSKKKSGNKIFGFRTIFQNVEEQYAFHNGGRSELQFNIGEEPSLN